MPEETPSFAIKSLGEKAKPNKKTARKSRPAAATAAVKKLNNDNGSKEKEINKQLASIYQDGDGQLPDMKKIKIKKSNSVYKFFLFVIIIGGLLATTAWAGLLLFPGSQKFSDDKIKLSVNGPAEITAGATTTYEINCENNQNLPLDAAVINIQYPKGFVFLASDPAAKNAGHTEWELGKIQPFKKKIIAITGLTFGSLNQEQSWRVFLTYQPENFNSQFQKASILNVTTRKSPFLLSLSGPDKVTMGNDALYTFALKQTEQTQTNKLELKPSWPENFFLASSTPILNKDGKWLIDLSPKTTSTIPANTLNLTFKILGKFSSSSEATGSISGALSIPANSDLFQIAQTKIDTELVQNNLDFNLAINGSMSDFNSQPGEILNMTISLKNQSDSELKNATLKLTLDAPSAKKQSLLDWPQIVDKYDADLKGIQINNAIRRGEITWTKTKIPELAKKNKEISVDVKLPLKDSSNFDLSALTAYQINAIAEIKFTDKTGALQTISSNPIAITINSDLKFETRDEASTDGTTHQLAWILTNNFHPLKNITLSADVYGDVSWENDSSTPAGQINFDEKNKKIAWTIPEMPLSVDVLALPFTLVLNKINPTQELLISKVHIQADDIITGQKLDFLGDETALGSQPN